jgi:hypothetical protein
MARRITSPMLIFSFFAFAVMRCLSAFEASKYTRVSLFICNNYSTPP